MSEEKIKVGFSVAVDKGPWWKTKIELEELGYLELHPGNIPAVGDFFLHNPVGDKIDDKFNVYKVICRYFSQNDQTWKIILQKMN